MPHSPYSCVLWDVDGTIADASEGIMKRLRTVYAEFGLAEPTPDILRAWIGPPMHESFQRLAGLSPERATAAVTRYREFAAADGYAASVSIYPGVAEVLAQVQVAGVPQATASSKPENQVRAILEHYRLDQYFVTMAGARVGPSGQSDTKSMVIADALARLQAAGVDTSRPVLIGDRHHDVEGGDEHGIPVIFVAWGFGDASESEGAVATVQDAAELTPLVLPS